MEMRVSHAECVRVGSSVIGMAKVADIRVGH